MLVQFDESHIRFKGTFVKLSPDDSQEQDTIIAGQGSCRSCRCQGYEPSKEAGYCKCGHAYSQHR
jgi:hypothetical protein